MEQVSWTYLNAMCFVAFICGLAVAFIVLEWVMPESPRRASTPGLPDTPPKPRPPKYITYIPMNRIALTPDDRAAIALLIGYLPQSDRESLAREFLRPRPEVQA